MLLAIDTSTRYAGVAIADRERVLTSRSWYSTSSHTAQLMPAIAGSLKELGLTLDNLHGIAVALGPGGFSALRVGVSTAKGLAMSVHKPLVGVTTLDLEAHPYIESGLSICALLDSGRKEVASACFSSKGDRTREDSISSPGELLSKIGSQTIFCGEGVLGRESTIKEALGDKAVIVRASSSSRLWSLVEIGRRRLANGESDDLVMLQPYYLRMPSIGGPKRRDFLPQQS